MSASEEMSPKARVSYDQHAFTVEFDVSEYSPEVRLLCGLAGLCV